MGYLHLWKPPGQSVLKTIRDSYELWFYLGPNLGQTKHWKKWKTDWNSYDCHFGSMMIGCEVESPKNCLARQGHNGRSRCQRTNGQTQGLQHPQYFWLSGITKILSPHSEGLSTFGFCLPLYRISQESLNSGMLNSRVSKTSNWGIVFLVFPRSREHNQNWTFLIGLVV